MKKFLRNCNFLLCLLPLPAIGGAWVAPLETGQIIASNYFPKSDSELQNEASIYSEYGIAKDNSIVISAAHLKYQNSNSGYVSSVGIKHQIYSKNNLVISGQINVQRNKIDIYHAAQTKYETRFLIGKNFGNGVWVNCELGLKAPKNNETFAYELAIGKNLQGGGNIIGKYLRDDFQSAVPVEKLQISVVRHIKNNWFFETGIRHDFNGYDGKENNGIIVGVWFKF